MNITILGAGSFGIALALVFHRNKNKICIWTKFDEERNLLEEKRCYEKVLPGVKIPYDIMITTDLKQALSKADIVVISIPVPFIKETMDTVQKYSKKNQYFVVASKGIDSASHLLLDELIQKYVPSSSVSILSGPTFASDLALGSPVALTLSSACVDAEKVICKALESSLVQIQSFPSPSAICICGALKNVFAIGSGMIAGMQFPVSTQAMYLTDALLEMRQILHHLGEDEDAIITYAGIGDLFLTCTSEKSRNFKLGYVMAVTSFEQVEKYQRENTVEGLSTLASFYTLLDKKGVHPPILSVLFSIFILKKDKQIFYDFLCNKNSI